MNKFSKWWNTNRISVYYYFWYTLFVMNVFTAFISIGYLLYIGQAHAHKSLAVKLAFMTGFCFIYLMIWRYYKDNPGEYEKIKKLREKRRKK